MSNVIQFKRPAAKAKHKGKTLCKNGFHKWETVDRPFDVKRGRLVTQFRCVRCGATKTESR